ncbi:MULTISPECIES: hypothetical protein [unclassified Rathayibacter]|uniref:hypothetical protein n=1 Tax=unclassified Rathayibacter TaxID=2609250 RepID=UPI0006F2FA7D|nr:MULTISPECIES: hypothetical protein [unclassified Rathayibacter]KQQ05991.1 hypothetical protein ASF42_05490 [Rathayibacter sp. Leaf294]KQS13848.1 hypothetical protein ASG06_05500 [Rathayibacter sp. Leaf185]
MQADDDERGDDERRDLERALYARPDGDPEADMRRREAARRLRIASEDAAGDPRDGLGAEGRAVDGASGPPHEGGASGPPTERASPGRRDRAEPAATRTPRRRAALIAAGALAAGLALGAAAASVALDQPPATAPTASPAATARPADRFEELVSGWETTADLPAGLALIAAGAEVYTPGFETTQNDRLLLTAPNGTSLCLALERSDATFSAGCTGLADFFEGNPLQVVGTALGEDAPVYTRVTLNPDGSIEGGFQLVGDDPGSD